MFNTDATHHLSDRLLHGLKTAIACLIGYVITYYLPIHQAPWILITVMVVMTAQSTLGSLLLKSYARLFGTVCGALIAAIILLLHFNHFWGMAIAISTAAFIFSFIATSQKDLYVVGGTLGSVTIVIILLGVNPTLQSAGLRFLEIVAGISIALLVSRFVFPLHASRLCKRDFIDGFQSVTQHYQHQIVQLNNDPTQTAETEEKLFNAFVKQRKLINEMIAELGKFHAQVNHYQLLLESERKLVRNINLIYYCLKFLPDELAHILAEQTLAPFHEWFFHNMTLVGVLLKRADTKPEPIASPMLDTAFQDLTQQYPVNQTALAALSFAIHALKSEIETLILQCTRI